MNTAIGILPQQLNEAQQAAAEFRRVMERLQQRQQKLLEQALGKTDEPED